MTVEVKLSARAEPGQRWRVKSTPITRKYGVNVYGGRAGDEKAWPGEVGEIVEKSYVAHDGTDQSVLRLEFSRGRHTAVEVVDLADFVQQGSRRNPDSCESCGVLGTVCPTCGQCEKCCDGEEDVEENPPRRLESYLIAGLEKQVSRVFRTSFEEHPQRSTDPALALQDARMDASAHVPAGVTGSFDDETLTFRVEQD